MVLQNIWLVSFPDGSGWYFPSVYPHTAISQIVKTHGPKLKKEGNNMTVRCELVAKNMTMDKFREEYLNNKES